MSRTTRATIGAMFGYVKFGIAIVLGLWLVPFTLRHVGAARYGLWLASGELLAYAALADFGVLATVPWLIAEADGKGDRERMRALLTAGGSAAILSALACAVVSLALWLLLPSVVHMGPAERDAVLGPLLTLALIGVVAHPLRVFQSVLEGIQDVRFTGALSLFSTVMNALITVVLLDRGFGLYALAFATAVPAVLVGVWNLVRVGSIAPDLLRHWQRPGWPAIRSMFVQGIGTSAAGWGWRLVSASDGLVLAALGNRSAVAALACTNKLAQALVQLSWVPCDSGLVGLAHLSGEQRGQRLRDAIIVMVRVYMALAGSVACIIIAVNPAFVTRWVGPDLFAGGIANILIAILVVTMTFGHALAVVPSVLGQRLQIGMATLMCGVIHVALAAGLGFRFGVVGVLLAGVMSHGLVFSALAWRPFTRATGMHETALFNDELLPWGVRMVPLVAIAFTLEQFAGVPRLPVTIATGGAIAMLGMLHMRPLYLAFGPVRALYDRLVQWLPFRVPSGADVT
jgi:O-antigen/teichoic acid export membrane protein